MSLQEQLSEDLKTAMRTGDTNRRDTIRLLTSSLKNERIAKMRDLTVDEEYAVVAREIKQRRESIEEFERAGRQDLGDKERAELAVLETYQPQQLSREEIESLVRQAIAETGATTPRDIGKVMQRLMPAVRGRADGRAVNQIVQSLLSSAG